MAKKFAEQMQFFRERKGLRKADLARLIGRSSAYITNIENENKKPPPPDIFILLKKSFSLSDSETLSFALAAIKERDLESGYFDVVIELMKKGKNSDSFLTEQKEKSLMKAFIKEQFGSLFNETVVDALCHKNTLDSLIRLHKRNDAVKKACLKLLKTWDGLTDKEVELMLNSVIQLTKRR